MSNASSPLPLSAWVAFFSEVRRLCRLMEQREAVAKADCLRLDKTHGQ